ncbi:MAG: CoB--CoM heterodisulfide reductase iron-sulfur subunit A family protein [Anaerolineae bacterium]|nr:CoB--CoM heterodisulfide reductase iron-sulfur subunit A family protein [Anaerolineae bacterium]
MPEAFEQKNHQNLESDSSDEEIRIGVYTCHCGGNISDVVHCERVAKSLGKLPDVVISRTDMSMCSDAGQSMVEEDIQERGLNRVIIGACAPSLHEQTFRGTVARAGLNPYLYHHVGIREQASWVHSHDPAGATDKAIRLMSAGIAKARHLKPLEPIRLDAEQHALVIGGGVAGLRAAWDIARQGLKVTLIEKSPFLGGRMAQLESVFPTGEMARELLHDLIEKVLAQPNITIHTQAELVGLQGYVGDYQAQIRQQSRGVSEDFVEVEAAIAACPVEIPDEFNYGLTTRKAIYRAYPGCHPETPAIDWEICTQCKKCQQVNGKGISLENKPKTLEIKVGAIVVATGFNLYEPPQGEYGYGELPEVMSLAKFIRLLSLTDQGNTLEWNGRPVRNIALIHCVGSRQIEGVHEPQPDGQVNDYCSRVCCTATLHVINEVKERFPNVNVFDVYEDIRTYGRGHEEYYKQASEKMVRFLRFHGEEMPEVMKDTQGDSHPVVVKVKDYLTWGEEIEVPVDLVVLATGIMPRPLDDIIKLLKISPGTDRFLLEVHPKLRPVETAVPGVVLAGSAQGPMNIQESCAAASAAAAKVAVLLGQGFVELEPFVAQVNPERCDGSGQCVEACCYEDAIALKTFSVNGQEVQKAVVTPANCAGCGVCVSACPNRAIDVQGWTLDQYEAMVEAIAAELPVLEVEA